MRENANSNHLGYPISFSRAVNAISKCKCNWERAIFGFTANVVSFEFHHASLLVKKEIRMMLNE